MVKNYRHRKRPNTRDRGVIASYLAGLTIKEVAERFDIHYQTAYTILKRFNVSRRSRGRRIGTPNRKPTVTAQLKPTNGAYDEVLSSDLSLLVNLLKNVTAKVVDRKPEVC